MITYKNRGGIFFIRFELSLIILSLIFAEEGTSDLALMKGETVIVIGNSPRRGYLVVEKRNHTIHVPYLLLAMK